MGGMVTAAGIYDLQGNPWAYSAGFAAQVAEVAAVSAHFAAPSGLAATGATIAGVKYMFVRGEENAEIYVKKGATGVIFYRCNTCIIGHARRQDPAGLVPDDGGQARRLPQGVGHL